MFSDKNNDDTNIFFQMKLMSLTTLSISMVRFHTFINEFLILVFNTGEELNNLTSLPEHTTGSSTNVRNVDLDGRNSSVCSPYSLPQVSHDSRPFFIPMLRNRGRGRGRCTTVPLDDV